MPPISRIHDRNCSYLDEDPGPVALHDEHQGPKEPVTVGVEHKGVIQIVHCLLEARGDTLT